MAKKCPNKSHPDFKAITEKHGESVAYLLYDINGQEIPSPEEADKLLKNAIKSDPQINSVLNSNDSKLTDFVLETLKKNYPDVKIFDSKKDFKAYVEKYDGHLNDANIKALGNAFRDAIYIDPTGPIQDLHFHERGHLYWNALGTDNKTKNKIIDFLKEQGVYESDLEEEAIKKITVAGHDIAQLEFEGSVLDKFLDLLKEFWIEVKKVFGNESLNDLNYLMAREIWNNKKQFKSSAFTRNFVMNMTVNPDNIYYDDTDHSYHFGGTTFFSVTRSLSIISTFYPELAANISWNSYVSKMKAAKTPVSEHVSEKNKFIDALKKRWELQAEIGTALHSVAQGIVQNKSEEDIANIIVNKQKGTMIKDYYEPEILKKTYDSLKSFIQKQIEDGWTVNSEVLLASIEHKMAGTADLILEREGKVIIIDFKTHFKEDNSSKFYGKYFKDVLTHVADTKENRHRLQTNIYANMYEMQEDVDVSQTVIIPFIYDINEENKVSGINKEKFITHTRAKRSAVKKDKNREEAYDVMKHSKRILELQATLKEKRESVKKKIKAEGTPQRLINEEEESEAMILSTIGKPMNEITGDDIGTIMQDGFAYLSEYLLNNLGYEKEDIVGKKSMSVEEFVNIALNKIEKKDYTYIDEEEELKKINPSDIDSLTKLNKILNDWNPMNTFSNYSLDELIKMYNEISGININKASNLRAFLSTEIFAKTAAEGIVESYNNPSPYINNYVILLGRLMKSDNALYNDFDSMNVIPSKWLRNPMLVSDKNILLQTFMKDIMSAQTTVVEKTVHARTEMQRLVDDTKFNNQDIPADKRKPLSHQDFMDVMYTDKYGLTRMMTPSEARTKLEKKYGRDQVLDTRPVRMANYLSLYYNLLEKHDPRIKEEFEYAYSLMNSWDNKDRKYFGPVIMPIKQMDWFEFRDKFKTMIGKWSVLKTTNAFDLLKKSEYDYVEIDGVPLYEIKKDLYNQMLKANESNDENRFDGIIKVLEAKTESAQNLYIRSSTKNKKIRIKGLQSSKITIISENINAAIQEHLASFLEAKHMERILPLADFVKEKYEKRNTTLRGGSQIATDAIDFIDQLIDAKVFHDIEDEMMKSVTGRKVGHALEFSMGLMARTYLGFSIAGNINNRATGWFQNWFYHPLSMARSFKRSLTGIARTIPFTEKGDKYSNIGYKKISNIVKNYNIASIVQDARFSKYQEWFDKFEGYAFTPLEFAELLNQGQLLKGMMTDEEIRAYNDNGNALRIYKGEIIDPDMDLSEMNDFQLKQFRYKIDHSKQHPDAFSKDRILHIKSAIAEVHGFYGWNRTSHSYYILGRSIGMLWFGWFQAGFRKLFSPITTDVMSIEHIGLTNAMWSILTDLTYNLNYTSARNKKKVKKALERVYGDHFETRKEAEDFLLAYNKYADLEDEIEEITVDDKQVYYVKRYMLNLSEFQKLLVDDKNATDMFGDLTNVHKLKKRDQIYYRAAVSTAILISAKIMLELMGLMLKNWDDDILYGDENEVTGKRGKKKALHEMTANEFRRHSLMQFVMKRTYMAGSDVAPIYSLDFWLNKTKTPIPFLGYAEKVSKTVKEVANRYEEPTATGRYLEPKLVNNLIGLMPYMNAPTKFGREMYRGMTNSIQSESAQAEANSYVAKFMKKIENAKKFGRTSDFDEFLDEIKNDEEALQERLKFIYLHKYYAKALPERYKNENEKYAKFISFVESSEIMVNEKVDKNKSYSKKFDREARKMFNELDETTETLRKAKNNN